MNSGNPITHVSAGASTASKIKVSDSTTDTHFAVPFHDGNNALHDDNGTFTYNPSTGTVSGTRFSGSGDGLSALNGTNISTGTVAAARMDAAQTAISSAYHTTLKIGKDAGNRLDFSGTSMIKVSVNDVDDEFRFSTGGNFHANNDITAYSTTTGSDKRLKTNIKDINYGLKDILNLRGVEFDWKEKRDGKNHLKTMFLVFWQNINYAFLQHLMEL